MNDDTTHHNTDEAAENDRTPTSRRTFIKAAGASAGALTLGATAASAQDVPTIVTELADDQLDPGETTTATVSLEDVPVGSAGVNVTLEVDPDVALITEIDINNSLLELELNDEIEEAGGGVDSILLPRIADIEESSVEVGTYHLEAQGDGETTLELQDFALTDPDSNVVREANYDAPTLTVGEPDDGPSPPSTPTSLEVVSTSESSIEVDWSADSNAASYNVYVDGSLEDETTTSSATVTGLDADTSYEIGVSAVGDDGDETSTATVTATTDAEDDEPPETTTVTVDLADSEIEPGDTTTVDLGLSEAPNGLLGFTVDLTIDDSVVSIADADISEPFPDTSSPISYVDIDGDTVRLSAIEPLDPGTTNIDFGHVELEGVAGGDTDIDVEVVRLEDLDDDDIPAETQSESLTVTGEEPPETPTVTVDPADDEIDTGETTTVDLGLTEAPDGLLGFTVDLTIDDSIVEITDATSASRSLIRPSQSATSTLRATLSASAPSSRSTPARPISTSVTSNSRGRPTATPTSTSKSSAWRISTTTISRQKPNPQPSPSWVNRLRNRRSSPKPSRSSRRLRAPSRSLGAPTPTRPASTSTSTAASTAIPR